MSLTDKLFMVLFQPRHTIDGQWVEPRSSYKLGIAFPKPYLV